MMRERQNVTVAFVMAVFMSLSAGVAGAGDLEDQHEMKRNSLELFLGGSHEEHKDGFTVGLVYEYRLHKYVGVGGVVEYAAKQFDEWVFAAPLFIHPYGGLRFAVAPGLSHGEGENKFLWRAALLRQPLRQRPEGMGRPVFCGPTIPEVKSCVHSTELAWYTAWASAG